VRHPTPPRPSASRVAGHVLPEVLRLAPAPATALVANLAHADLGSLLADGDSLAQGGRFDYLLGSMLPQPGGWRFMLEAVQYLANAERADERALLDGLTAATAELNTTPFLDHASRLDTLVAQMKREGTWAAVAIAHPDA
jgi:hypothetical protein